MSEVIEYKFNERKAAQAAAYLLGLHDGSINYLKLIKLLYFADRKTIVETGFPITGDRFVSMNKGPVLSEIYDLIIWGPANTEDQSTPWFEYIGEPRSYKVSLKKNSPETDELSEYELESLFEINAKYGSMDKWELVDLTHQLPEWKFPNGSSYPIDPSQILQEEGASPQQIKEIAQEANELLRVQSLEGLFR